MTFSSDLKEELSKVNNLANKIQVKYEFIGYLISNNSSVVGNKIRYATESQYNILVEKMNSRDDRICWVTEKEIEKLCANGIERNLGTNTPWIVEGGKNE